MSPFVGTPFRALLLSVALASATLLPGAAIAEPAPKADTPLLADFRSGGSELFADTIPSMIQVFNGGGGSGYVIDKGGYAITNFHVTGDASHFEITLYGGDVTGTHYKGTLVGTDPALDFALIQVHAPDDLIVPIKLADTDKMKSGDTVATCGSPGGSAGAVNVADGREGWLDYFNFNMGLLTEIIPMDRSTLLLDGYYGHESSASLGSLDYGTAVQYLFHVDAPINHGNSGGPCINARGEAIGTNTWKFHYPYEKLGFSVPVNLLARSAREILQYGRVRRPWLGICLHDRYVLNSDRRAADRDLTDIAGLPLVPEPDRLRITNINKYSPAAQYLEIGDVILSVDGVRYKNIFDVYKYILNKQVGDPVTLHIERDGVGLPPITIQLAEKRNRFTSTHINMSGSGRSVRAGGSRAVGGGVVGVTY